MEILNGIGSITEQEIVKLKAKIGDYIGIAGKLHKYEYIDEEEECSRSEDILLAHDQYIIKIEGIWGVEIDGQKYMTHLIGEGGSRECRGLGAINGRIHSLRQFVGGRYGGYTFDAVSIHNLSPPKSGKEIWKMNGEFDFRSIDRVIGQYLKKDVHNLHRNATLLTEHITHCTHVHECVPLSIAPTEEDIEKAVKEYLLRIV
ncbi:MAG: hypothetical protein KKE20_02880 [Nanoarchaeota archaeon]|nr:hypothetical protein [Nanoarchaeota archaeon]